MLADLDGNIFATLGVDVGEDVLDEIVAELITRDVDERHAWTIWSGLANALKVAVEEFLATDLEALLDDLGGELIHAILASKAYDMVNGTSTVNDGAVLANVLNTPVTELAVGDDIDARKDLVDARTLVFLEAVLEDVLDDKTASLAESHLVPHTAKSFVDILHDLWWRVAPAELEQLLPNVTGVAVNDSLWDAAQ